MRKLVLLLSAVVLFAACEKPSDTTVSTDAEKSSAFSMTKKAGEEAVETASGTIPEWAEGIDIATVDVKEEVSRIKEAMEDARTSFMAKYKKASEEDRLAMRGDFPSPVPFAAHINSVIESQPDAPGLLSAYAFLAGQRGEFAEKAIDVLFEKYSDSEEMKGLYGPLVYGTPSQKTEDRLKSLMESSDKDLAGMSTYGLAGYLSSLEDSKKQYVKFPESAPSPETIEYVNSRDVEEGEIVALYRKVVEEYPDVKVNKRAIGKLCSGELFALENLAVGKVAPDIEGEDMDGVAFKLSDYRGKVVMLDFWGDW